MIPVLAFPFPAAAADSATGLHHVRVSAGWNLLSIPATVGDGSHGLLFPSAASRAYTYDGGYLPQDTLRPGIGYWVKFDSAGLVPIEGVGVTGDTLRVRKGWNLIGGLAIPLAVSLLETNPPGIVASPFYRYVPDSGYQSCDTLEPGFGYWVKAGREGLIVQPVQTVLLDDSTLQPENSPHFQSASVDSASIVLTYASAGDLPDLPPGRFLVGNSGGGYFRRVVSSVPDGNTLTVQTEVAGLDEVYDYVQIDTSFEILFPDPLELQMLLSNPLHSEGRAGGLRYELTGSAPIVGVSPDATLLDLRFPNVALQVSHESGQVSVGMDTLIYRLEASITNFDLDLAFDPFSPLGVTLERFRFTTRLAPSITFHNLKFSVTGQLERTDSIPLANLPLPPIPTAVPGVILTPQLNLLLGLTSSVGVSAGSQFKDTIGAGLTLEVGFDYEGGELHPVWTADATGRVQTGQELFGVGTTGQVLFLKPSLEFLVNGLVGAGIFAKPYVYDQFSWPPFAGEIGGGVAGGVMAGVKVWSRYLLNVERTLADYRWKWWEAAGPMAPSNPVPADGEQAAGLAPRLQWRCSDPGGDPIRYDVYFGTEDPPTILVAEDIPDTSFSLDTLDEGTLYRWKIVATDTTGLTTEGPVWTFRAGTVPEAPVLAAPADGAVMQPARPVLVWHPSEGAASYTVQVMKFDPGLEIVQSIAGLTDTSWQAGALEDSTTYFWLVIAIDSNGPSPPSPTWSFSTQSIPPVPFPSWPSYGTTDYWLNAWLQWTISPGATGYTLQVSSDSTFTVVDLEFTASTDNAYAPGVEGSSTYFWRVNATNSMGASAWSAPYKFTTVVVSSCGSVSYAGRSYGTTLIGTQCWLNKNLDVGTMIPAGQPQPDTGVIEKYCYNNDQANCDRYGGLYQWNEAMQHSTTPGSRGICPTGWHIPTRAELSTLTNTIGPVSGIDGALPFLAAGEMGGVNTSGFSGLLGGYVATNGFSYEKGYRGYWWSSTADSPTTAEGLNAGTSDAVINGFGGMPRNAGGISVRCLRN